MPLVYQQNINLNSRLAVWHISENEDFFYMKVSLQSSITHPHKRLQHLAGRYLLQELYEDFPLELILIADTKKPFLTDEEYHFSISHCGDYAAALVSKTDRVGVDIEIPQSKIKVIRHKFLTDKEMFILEKLHLKEEEALTLGWSIKESVFKWYGKGMVDFKDHIQIENIGFQNEIYTVNCRFRKGLQIELIVHGLFMNGNCLTWLNSSPG